MVIFFFDNLFPFWLAVFSVVFLSLSFVVDTEISECRKKKVSIFSDIWKQKGKMKKKKEKLFFFREKDEKKKEQLTK